MTFKGAELNYPVHEKELLSVIRALKKWRSDLLGSPIYMYTDHKTLENFDTQRDLSHRQARWMEYMSQFETSFVYVRGEDNTGADALSRLPVHEYTDSTDAEGNARSAYEYCEYLDDDCTPICTVNSILAVGRDSPF